MQHSKKNSLGNVHAVKLRFFRLWRREMLDVDTVAMFTRVLASIQILVENVEYVIVQLLKPPYSVHHPVQILSHAQRITKTMKWHSRSEAIHSLTYVDKKNLTVHVRQKKNKNIPGFKLRSTVPGVAIKFKYSDVEG